MRYKYVVKKNAGDHRLSLDEYARIEAEAFSLLHQKTFDLKSVESVVSGTRKELISLLRTDNLYPPSGIMEKIADAITKLMGSEDQYIAEVVADDLDFLEGRGKRIRPTVPVQAEVAEIEMAEDIDVEPADTPQTVPLNESPEVFDDLFPFDEVA